MRAWIHTSSGWFRRGDGRFLGDSRGILGVLLHLLTQELGAWPPGAPLRENRYLWDGNPEGCP